MRMRLECLQLLVLIILFNTAAVCADETPDARLAEKVTIDCVNGRLYNALDRISDETGVTLRTGRNTHEWQVRDYPILVCARELPLGTLLQSIADATHLLFSKTEAENDTVYREGRDLIILAGSSVTRTLPMGTPADVKRELDWLVECGPRTGLFLGASSSIAPGVPWENLRTLIEGMQFYRTHGRER